MSSISGLGSIVSSFFTSTPTISTKSSDTVSGDPQPSSQGFTVDSLGVPTNNGILGLPTTGAPGDSDLLLAEVELKLQQTIGQTRDNRDATQAAGAAALEQIIISGAAIIKAAQQAIVSDNTNLGIDQANLNVQQNNLSSAYNQLTGYNYDNESNPTGGSDLGKLNAINNTVNNDNNKINQDYYTYYHTTGNAQAAAQTAIGNDYTKLYSDEGLQSTANTAVNNDRSTISQIQGNITTLNTEMNALNSDIITQSATIQTETGLITQAIADLASLLSTGHLPVIDKETADDTTNRLQFENIGDTLKTLSKYTQDFVRANLDPSDDVDQQTLGKLLTDAATLVSGLNDLVNTLTQLNIRPDPNANGQAFATSGSRLKLQL